MLTLYSTLRPARPGFVVPERTLEASLIFMKNALAFPTPFVGRTKELVDITARLLNPDCRLLTLIGLGGSGKTRLAIEATTTVATSFTHGTVFVGLQPLLRSELLVSTIAQAVGLTFYGHGEPREQLLDYLHDKTLLLLLDNFEHVLDGAELVMTLLANAPGITVLVTSREALNVQEEWLYPLKGMSTPPSAYATSVEDYEAVQLFLYHARRVKPQFDLANDHEFVTQICQMTAGLPLAIELAASWLKGSSTAHIAHAMRHNLDILSTTTRNVEERHRSMRAVFDHSWASLSDNERLIFARLSVFPGGFDSHAASQVAEASFSSLATLVEKSLVHMDSAERFCIHEMLRQYGTEQLEAQGKSEATYAHYSQYFAHLMLQHEAALKQPQHSETLQAIERDFENIRLAWEWSAKNQCVSNLHAMLHGLYLFGFLRSRYRETMTIFDQTLGQSVADVPLLGRLVVRRWGYLHWWHQTDYREAITRIEQALTIAVAENNQFEIALCHLMTAYTCISTRRYAEALPHLESSQALFDALNEPYYVCWVMHRLGYVYSNLNNTIKGNAYNEQSLSLARVTHNRVALVICLYNLGSNYTLHGDYVKGRHYCAEALHVATELGHRGQIAHALSLLGLCAFCQGEYTICQNYAEQAYAINEELNRFMFHAYNLSLLILLTCLREDYTEGIRLNELGKCHSTNTMGLQLLYWSLAALACGVGNAAEVRVYVQKALQLAIPEVNPGPTIWIVPCVVYPLMETDLEKAVELLAWVFSYPDTALTWARQWPLLDRLQVQLQSVMDHDSYHSHWEEGKAFTFDTISAYLQHTFCDSLDARATTQHQDILTAREGDVLRLMAVGMTNPQIATQLVIATGTVKTHTLRIYRKLDVANRTQAIVRAQEWGLLPA